MNQFAKYISFTVTNRCNLQCAMCGQWNKTSGYMRRKNHPENDEMKPDQWIKLIDQIKTQGNASFLIRGGEPFCYKGIMEILNYAASQNLFVSIDTNGTLLDRYAARIARLGNIHLTVSVDGPEAIHDQVRGLPGCYRRIKKGIETVQKESQKQNKTVSLSLNFTISPHSVAGLGALPDAARDLGVNTVTIVPYYWVPETLGHQYEEVLKNHFHSPANSWKGFHREESGVNFEEFQKQYAAFLANLGDIKAFPYMKMTLDEYRDWFTSPDKAVLKNQCPNTQNLMDIQPNGDVNFCVDFPDYCFGNVKTASLPHIWNSSEAAAFRDYRKKHKLGVCHRCGAKYMADLAE